MFLSSPSPSPSLPPPPLPPPLPPPSPPSIIQVQEFGKTETKDLKPDGVNIAVTEANKREYVQLACQMKMTVSIRVQIKSFLEGFYEIIPKELIAIFNEQELELLISGLPSIDIDDLKANSEYHKYNENSLQVCVCVCAHVHVHVHVCVRV